MTNPRRNIVESLSDSQRSFLSLPEFSVPTTNGEKVQSSQSQPTASARRQFAAEANPGRHRANHLHGAGTERFQRPEPLRSVTLRLRASTAEALRRASIQRSLDYIEPFSQQAIVEAALHRWLEDSGFLSAE